MADEGQKDRVDDEGRYVFDPPPEPEDEGEEGPPEDAGELGEPPSPGEKEVKRESLVSRIDRLVLESELALDKVKGCPLRTRSYGGIPASGGFTSWMEYEVGAGTASEAAHCILGSLGRMLHLDREKVPGLASGAARGHLAHIKEELEIIEKTVKEYARPVYIRQVIERAGTEYADGMVEDIRDVAHELMKRAKRAKAKLRPDETPPDILAVAEATYDFLITLSRELLDSIRGYPDDVDNAFASARVKSATRELSDAVAKLFKTYAYG